MGHRILGAQHKARWRTLLPSAFLIAATVLEFSGQGLGGLVQTAQASCNPGRTPSSGNWWDGWQSVPGGTVGGVYSTLTNYTPYVYGNSIGAIWVLVFDPTIDWYAQDGWYAQPGSGYTGSGFLEYVNTAGQQIRYGIVFPNGSTTTYAVLYNCPSSGMVTFEFAGSEILQVRVGFTPDDGQIMGEVTNFANQMVGGTSDHAVMSGSAIYFAGSWNSFSGSVYNSSTDYGNSVLSNTKAEVWDKACPS
jgi:hypothetical protein